MWRSGGKVSLDPLSDVSAFMRTLPPMVWGWLNSLRRVTWYSKGSCFWRNVCDRLSNSCSYVKIRIELSTPFDTVQGFRQSDSLLCDLFNFVMEGALRKARVHCNGIVFQKSVQLLAYSLASQTTHVVCVNFICDWLDLQFNVVFERQISEKVFHNNLFYSQSFCKKSAERKIYIYT